MGWVASSWKQGQHLLGLYINIHAEPHKHLTPSSARANGVILEEGTGHSGLPSLADKSQKPAGLL